MLKDFWFPFFLFLSALVPAFIGSQMGGNGRRTMFTITAVLAFAGVLSFIWGDPVRGPFANLIHPNNPETFTFQAGIPCVFHVKELKDGIDFSRCIDVGGNPIQLRVQKTWWSGLKIDVTLLGPGGIPILVFNEKEVKSVGAGWDVNYDDYAFELVSETRAPVFQFVMAADYSAVYLNMIMSSPPNGVIFLKDTTLALVSVQEAQKPEYRLDRMFKYPFYRHKGERQ